MAAPVLIAVDQDRDVAAEVERQLVQRYGKEYRVAAYSDPDETLGELAELRDAGAEVAVVFAGPSATTTGRGELFEEVRRLHPHAKRALLVSANAWADEPTAAAIRAAMALGRIDHYVLRPVASPDEVFHEAVSDFLLEWARERRLVPQTVHIVGEEWSGRAYELREVFTRCAVPHAFCLADSDEGRELLRKAGPVTELPVMLLPDGRVLSNPTDAEIAEAAGAPSALEETTFDVVVVGAGPAGLSAAVYAASEGFARARRRLRWDRRPGGCELADPQLPRVREGDQRQPACGGGVRAGGRVRRQLPVPAPCRGLRALGRLVQAIDAAPNLFVRTGTAVVGGGGDGRLQELILRASGEGDTTVPADALFVMIGARPQTDWLPPEVVRDEEGFVLTGDDVPEEGWPLARRPLALETSLPGVLAAGDVRHASVKRVAAAVGEGSVAAQLVHRLFEEAVEQAAPREGVT